MLKHPFSTLLIWVMASMVTPARADTSVLDALAHSWKNTHLLSLTQGSVHEGQLSNIRNGGFELSNGKYVSFRDWYTTDWKDAQIKFLTQVTPNLGLIWGLSTGERGEKYEIAPSLTLGLALQYPLRKNVKLGITATNSWGGMLREKPCTADYGAIGGIQSVNCRLAATFLPPAETLNYLLNEPPRQAQIRVRLDWTF